ncbi:MAG: TauD/TfdA family dioxygenase [Alphaproteobacteria bacterium]|nr:TauD/TfdA family dioxygenase [Alphaproteobacteria bacterium]
MSFEIRPLPGVTGAEVLEFDLDRDGAGEAARQRLQDAWTDRVVLVFRGMEIDEAGFMRLAGLFGENVPQPVQRPEYRVEGFPFIRLLSSLHRDSLGDNKPLNVGGTWHTDHSHLPDPPRGTVLRAIRLPGEGGDTSFTNQRAAYEALDEETRREVDPLVGLHIYNSRYAPRRMATMTPEEEREAPSARHPLVRPHPVSGRKTLYFNPIRIERFEGMDPAASQALMERLVAHCEQDRFVYRHRWRAGDVLIWDNAQALHMVRHDYDPARERVMHRTLVG